MKAFLFTNDEAELLLEMVQAFTQAGLEEQENDPEFQEDLPMLFRIINVLKDGSGQSSESETIL